jgi:serine/threonine protein kinase
MNRSKQFVVSAAYFSWHPLVFLSDAEDGDVRLGDFGLCRRAAEKNAPQSYSEGGTDTYMPPEVMLGSKLDGTKVGGLLPLRLLPLLRLPPH